MDTPVKQRLAWGITGSGHYLREYLEIVHGSGSVDLLLSAAAAEVLSMYGHEVAKLHSEIRVFRDTTASPVRVEFFYHGHYHTAVIAPATSNTVAKMVYGISDTLATNIHAQASKCRVPSIVFARATQPEVESEAPEGMVMVYLRRIDLENAEKLKTFEATTVVEDMAALKKAIDARACSH